MTENRSPDEQLDRSWDGNALAWTATVRGGLIESRRVATDRAILDATRRLSPRRVLDVGCGEGWLCRALNGAGVACTGLDGSSHLIAAARAADPAGTYQLLRYAEFRRLEEVVEASSFDVVVCNFSLLHEHIAPILRSVREVLRIGGTLLIQTVHPWLVSEGQEYIDGWRIEDFSWAKHPFPEPMPWYFRTLDSWARTLGEAGFTIAGIAEPLNPETRKPLSLMFSAAPGSAP